MGGKITSGSAYPPGASLTPPSTHPAPSWRRRRPAWLERVMQHSDYFYLAGVIVVILLSAYILLFD